MRPIVFCVPACNARAGFPALVLCSVCCSVIGMPLLASAESLVTRTDEPELQGGGAREGEEVALTIPPDGDLNNSKSLYERADSARELTQGPSLGSDQWASRAFSDVVSEEQAVEDAWGFNQVYFMGRSDLPNL